MTAAGHRPISRLTATEVIAAIAFSLIPIVGILFWDWSPFALIFLYWLENVLIGVRTIASLLATGILHQPGTAIAAIALSAFFALHYGLFCLVHGTFVVSMFGDVPYSGLDADNLIAVGTQLFEKQPNLMIGLASIALWQVVEFVIFLVREASIIRDVNMVSLRELMMSPYPRIVVLHVTIIFGGFLLMATGWPLLGVVALALFKLAYDVACALGWTPIRIAHALRPDEPA